MTIEDRLAGLLRERADRPVDADALLSTVLAAGRARARRRQGTYAVAGAGVAGVAAATLMLNLGPDALTDNPAAAGWDTVPALPVVAGEPGAADRPDLVGTDPTVLRFTVPWAPLPVTAVSWTAREGIEEIDVSMVSGDVFVTGRVAMWRGADRRDTDNGSVPNQTSSAVVDGHQAVVRQEQFDWGPNQWLTWHPADGLTVEVGLVASGSSSADGSAEQATTQEQATAVGIAELVEFANAVRLDTTTACSTPFRMTFAPPEARQLTCYGTLGTMESGEETRYGGVLLTTGSRLFEVDYNTLTDDSLETASPETVSPSPRPAPPAALHRRSRPPGPRTSRGRRASPRRSPAGASRRPTRQGNDSCARN